MHRGTAAATLVLVAIALLSLAILQGLMWGYPLVAAVPALGLVMAIALFFSMRRLCTTPSRGAEAFTLGCLLALPAIAYFGVSFGGFQLLLPGTLLAVAAVITPRPARSPAGR